MGIHKNKKERDKIESKDETEIWSDTLIDIHVYANSNAFPEANIPAYRLVQPHE